MLWALQPSLFNKENNEPIKLVLRTRCCALGCVSVAAGCRMQDKQQRQEGSSEEKSVDTCPPKG